MLVATKQSDDDCERMKGKFNGRCSRSSSSIQLTRWKDKMCHMTKIDSQAQEYVFADQLDDEIDARWLPLVANIHNTKLRGLGVLTLILWYFLISISPRL